jgi:hypothetical protein
MYLITQRLRVVRRIRPGNSVLPVHQRCSETQDDHPESFFIEMHRFIRPNFFFKTLHGNIGPVRRPTAESRPLRWTQQHVHWTNQNGTVEIGYGSSFSRSRIRHLPPYTCTRNDPRDYRATSEKTRALKQLFVSAVPSSANRYVRAAKPLCTIHYTRRVYSFTNCTRVNAYLSWKNNFLTTRTFAYVVHRQTAENHVQQMDGREEEKNPWKRRNYIRTAKL